MRKPFYIFSMFLFVLSFITFQAEANNYLIVTASNDVNDNKLLVYSSDGKLLQSLSTGGQGGVDPDIVGGAIAENGTYLAVINYNSQSVSLFKQEGGLYQKIQTIDTLSKPVSLAFGHDHLYILGTTTIESHKMKGDRLENTPDGSTDLLVGDGSGAQVGVLLKQLIISERSNTIELVDMQNGAVGQNIVPVQLPPPPNNDTPVGLVTRGNVAYVTIAHSDKVGVVKDGELIKLVSSGSQHAPCWLALQGSWLYSSNTPSKTLSRYRVTDNSIELVEEIAARSQKGLPSDMDANGGILAVLETDKGMAYLTQYRINNDGKLNLINSFSTAPKANGVAVINLKNP